MDMLGRAVLRLLRPVATPLLLRLDHRVADAVRHTGLGAAVAQLRADAAVLTSLVQAQREAFERLEAAQHELLRPVPNPGEATAGERAMRRDAAYVRVALQRIEAALALHAAQIGALSDAVCEVVRPGGPAA